jgi:uncharacterized protein (TIGR02996 family)
VTQDDAFLADIAEHPDDDAPRLIYADWLMDQGDPLSAARGEFIRLQVELARAGLPAAEQARHRARIQELLEQNWEAWVGPLRTAIGVENAEPWMQGGYCLDGLYKFRRGFVEEMNLPLAAFTAAGERLCRMTPLRHLKIRSQTHRPDFAESIEAFAASPWLARLSSLDLSPYYLNGFGPEGMALLARSPFLRRLTTLNLYRNDIGNEGAAALAEAPWLAGLRWLNLTDNQLTPDGLHALRASPFVPALGWLRVANNPVGEDLSSLVGWQALRRIQFLGLKECGIAARYAGTVRDILRGLPVRSLDLDYNSLGPDGLSELLRDESLQSLRQLSLMGCELGDEGVELLTRAPALRGLEGLGLARNGVTDRGARLLAQEAPFLARLESLGLEGNNITHEGAEVLKRSPFLVRLRSVNLARNPCTQET